MPLVHPEHCMSPTKGTALLLTNKHQTPAFCILRRECCAVCSCRMPGCEGWLGRMDLLLTPLCPVHPPVTRKKKPNGASSFWIWYKSHHWVCLLMLGSHFQPSAYISAVHIKNFLDTPRKVPFWTLPTPSSMTYTAWHHSSLCQQEAALPRQLSRLPFIYFESQ